MRWMEKNANWSLRKIQAQPSGILREQKRFPPPVIGTFTDLSGAASLIR